jgi:DNA polymerase IV
VKAGSIAWAIKEKISAQLLLSASAGVGCNKLVAKIASGFRKPNGLTVVPPDQTLSFLWPLEVGDLWGVGPVAQAKLHKLGVKTVEDLHAVDQAQLILQFGKFGLTLWEMARGIDLRAVEANRETKSISAEHTFESDVSGEEGLHLLSSLLSSQVEEVTHRLTGEALEAHTVTVKLKFSDFSNRTRSQKLSGPTQDSRLFDQCAQALLAAQRPLPPVRLIGVGLSQLCPVERTRQLELDLF